MRFNSPVSFFDKSKWLLFTSRDLRETNGVRFYNDQAELCMVWYILSIKDGSLDGTHPKIHIEIQDKWISVCRTNTGIQQPINETGKMMNSKTAEKYFLFLLYSGETFSENANIFLFATFLDHINCCVSNHTNLPYLAF